jgi:RNA recognition motif-containing protein
MNLYVGSMSYELTEADLRQAFESFGRVQSVNIIKDKYSGQSRGFGFVEMPDSAEGNAAIQGLNGKEFFGQSLKVSEARPRTDRPGSGGRSNYGGRNRY